MYIDQMEITGFGVYSGLTLNLEQGLNIILGQNEAGKSTCHEFVRFMLYGPLTGPGSRDAPRYEPLRGGEHGGGLELVTQAGQSFRLTRKGKTPHKFSLVDENMEELGPEMLAHILGQAGPELYNTVFAFSIKELYELNALDPEKTPDVFCGINFGLGPISISGVLKKLKQQCEKIYKPGGSLPLLNGLFKELGQAREKLAPLRHNLEEYAALEAQLAAMVGESQGLQAELDRLNAEQGKFKTAQRLFPLWQERGSLEEALRNLPDLEGRDFQLDDAARLEQIEARQKDNAAQAARLQARLDELEARLAVTPPNPVLLEMDEFLATLAGRRGQYSESLELIPRKKARLAEIRADMGNIQAGLEQNWTRGQAISFNFSRKADLEQLLADVEQSGRDAALAQGEETRLLREAEALAAPDKLADLPPADVLRANLRALRELRGQRDNLNYQLEVETLNARDRRRTAQYGALLLGVYCALIGGIAAGLWLPPGLNMGAGLGVGLGCLALSAILARLLPQKPDQAVTALETRLAGVIAEIEAPGAALGIKELSDAEFAAAQERIDRIAQVEQLKARAATEKVKADTSNNNFAGLRVKLREALIPLGINPDCEAGEVRSILERVQKLQPLLAEEAALKEDIERLERRLDEFSNDLGLLVGRTGLAWQLDARSVPDPLATLAGVEAAVQAAKAALQAREHLARQGVELRAELQNCAEAGKALTDGLQELLRVRGVHSPDEFRQTFAQWRAARDHKTRLEQTHKEILTGAGERRDEVLHLLGYISEEKLTAQIANLAHQVEKQSRLVAAQHQQQGQIRQRRDALLDERHFEELRFKEEALKQEMTEGARAWAAAALARHAVEEAKAFFEQERQPEVMRAASGWFKTITLGEYAGISPSSEPGALEVLTAKKEPRLVTQLSRGTREQLFLAMRLALIHERGREAEPLPVLMDDILVNFDPERARAAASAVLSLAGDHQILFFTCHPHTARIFEELAQEQRRPVGAFVIDDGCLR